MFGSIINALFHKEREDNLTLTKQKAKEIMGRFRGTSGLFSSWTSGLSA